ncbi:MAG: hypothetical protein FJY18_01530, partial [Bacteroidetes bacterium]|nr:hypothetical protein [Bacteroidota bacterium]
CTTPADAGVLSGTQSICVAGTSTFSSTVAGGSWSSSNTAVATVNATTGVVTAVSAGTATMTYTVTGTGGCPDGTATRTVTVNQPSASTISQTICAPNTYSFNGQSYSTSGTYTATLTNAVGCDSVATLILTVLNLQITTQPVSSLSLNSGATGSLSVVAQGATTYQWQVSIGGGAWTNLNNDVNYNGVTTATLGITAVITMNGNQYRVLVSNSTCPTLTSSVSTITVSTPVPTVVLGQVSSCPGSVVTVPINVQNFLNIGAVSLDMFYDSTALTFTGFNSSALTGNLIVNNPGPAGSPFGRVLISWFNLTASNLGNGLMMNLTFNVNKSSAITWNLADAGQCELGDGNGDVISNAIFTNGSVTALGAQITTQPAPSLSLNVGAAGGFSVQAIGATSYQWQVSIGGGTWFNLVDGSVYSGVTTSSLGFVASSALNGNQYRVIVSGAACADVISSAGTLTVTIPAVLASVTTAPVSGISSTSATSGGNVSSDGGASVTARGVAYGTGLNPTTAGSSTSNGSGIGSFTSILNGLSPSTNYYVRAYAVNSVGTAYGNQINFTTLDPPIELPTVSTAPISGVTHNTAITGGNVSANGGAMVTARGVVYGTNQNPSISGLFTLDGSGNGLFISSLSGLAPSTSYFVRAYATNSAGTAYGNELSFSTLAPPAVLASVTTAGITSITSNGATTGGNVISDGGAAVTARGVAYGTGVNPLVSGPSTNNGSGTGVFTSTLSGLTPVTVYYVRAYATNSVGTAYGSELNFTTLSQLLPSVGLGTVSGCIGDTLVVPVTMLNANSIGAITLGLTYNATSFEFIGASGLHPSIASSAIINSPAPGGAVFVSWYDLVPANVNGLLMNLKFRALSSGVSSALTWDVNFNELADSTASPISGVSYTNGAISVGAAPSVALGSATGCVGSILGIPVSLNSACGVGAISLTIPYDVSKLSFAGYVGVSSLINDSNLTVNASQSAVAISWFGYPAILPAGNLLTLNFNLLSGGTTSLSVQTPISEIANGSGVAYPSVAYQSGSITAQGVTIGAVQGNLNVYVGGSTTLSASVQGAQSQQWQLSIDGGQAWSNVMNSGAYSGATTNQLRISGVLASFANHQYRLQATGNGGCQSVSSAVALSVLIPNLSASSVQGCSGDTVQVSVSLTNAPNLGAISLALNYDAQSVQFIGFNNVNSQISSNVIINAPAPGGTIIVSWYNLTAANINGSLANFRFRMLNATGSSLDWDQSIVELADIEGVVVGAINYSNGGVTPRATPSFIGSGIAGNTSLPIGSSTVLTAQTNAPASTYQWQLNTGSGWVNLSNDATYSGVATSSLTISNIPTSFNGYSYRYIASITGGCFATSGSATLIVNVPPPALSFAPSIGCVGDTISVGVNLAYGFNLGAITLGINYDAAQFEYVGSSNVNASVAPNFLINAPAPGGAVLVSWYDVNSVTVNGLLFNMRFRVLSSGVSAPLNWDVAFSELADSAAVVISGVTYTNSSLASHSAPIVAVGSASGCVGSVVSVPVNLTSACPVGAISLAIPYNASLLNFTGYSGASSVVNDSNLTVNASNGSIFISWFGYPAALPSGALLNMNFELLNSGTSAISVNSSGSEIANGMGVAYAGVSYTSGSVVATGPVAGIITGNTQVFVGGTTRFTSVLQGAVSQQWQLSTDGGTSWSNVSNGGNYTGSTTNQLTISGIVSSLDDYRYRLLVTGAGGCQTISSPVILNVLIPNLSISSGSGCSGDTVQVAVSLSDAPNLGAISLALNYNASAVQFIGFNSVNSQIASNTIINAPAPGGVVYVSWYNLIPASINGSVVNFRFRMLTGAGSDLNWDQSVVELADIEGTVVGAVSYTNGAVVGLATPSFTGNGVYGNTSVGVGGTVRLAALVSSTSNLQWQINNGSNSWSNLANDATYNGVTSNELVISSVPNTLNGATYRVLANETGGCSAVSGTATLTVLSEPLVAGLSAGSALTCQGGNVSIPVSISNAFAVTSGTIKLLFNSSALTYNSYNNVLSDLTSSGFNVTASGDTISINWSSTLPLNLNGVLAQLQFTVNSISGSSFSWYTAGSQINGPLGSSLTGIAYGNGNVGVQVVSFGSISGNTSLYIGQATSLTASASGFSSLRWQSSTNGTTWTDLNFSSTYGGVITQTLTITNAGLALNNTQFRLSAVSPLGCVYNSSPVTLTVTLAPGGPQVFMGSASGCLGDTISVPVGIMNGPDIAAVSLVLNYDNQMFRFVGIDQAIPQFGSTFIVNEPLPGGTVYFAWYDVNPIFANGNLFNARFVPLSVGSSALSWNTTQSELASSTGDVILNTTYSNGNVSSDVAPSFTGGVTGLLSIPLFGSTTLSAVVNGATVLQWQSSTDGIQWSNIVDGPNYSGTATAQLSISNASLTMNGLRYRLSAQNALGCSRYSAAVTLSINVPDPIVLLANATGCSTDTLVIPVTLLNGYNLGAITLGLNYNASQFEFVGTTNVSSSVASSMLINSPAPGGSVLVSWYDVNPAQVNGLLFNLRFRPLATGVSSPVSWDLSFNELADSSANVFTNVTYTNGSLTVQPAPSVAVGNAAGCVGSSVSVPVSINSSCPVGAISLTMPYNASVLSYTGFNSALGVINDSNLTVNAANGNIYISWFGYPAVTPSGNLLNLNFNVLSAGNASISVNASASEIANGMATPYSGVTYTSGVVTATGPVAGPVTGNTQVFVGGVTRLKSVLTGAVSQQWQVSVDGGNTWTNVSNSSNYSGVTTNELTISSIVTAFDDYRYRLVVTGTGGCQTISSSVALNVLIPNVGITSASACSGDTVQVSVSITDGLNLGAISMALNYDAAAVQFVGFNNVNSAIASNVIINAPTPGGTVIVSWYNLIPANINGQLMNLRFRMLNSTGSSLVWDQSVVELADIEGNVVGALTYTNGAVNSLPVPSFVGNGVYGNTSVGVGGSVQLFALANGSPALQWQVNTGNGQWTNLVNDATYAGVNSTQLNIASISNGLNGYSYRVVASLSGGCSSTSGIATLSVLSEPLAIVAGISNVLGCQGGSVSIPLNLSNAFAVSSASLKVLYNPAQLSYTGFSGLNANLAGSNASVTATGDTLTISWSTSLPLNLNGSLLNLQFNVLSSNGGTLSWNQVASQLNNPAGGLISGVTYASGGVTVQQASIGTITGNSTLFLGQSTTLSATVSGFSSLRWQVSSDGLTWSNVNASAVYSGVLTMSLGINANSLSLNGLSYRIAATSPLGCVSFSAPVTLNVSLAPGGPVVFAGSASACVGDTILVPIGINNAPDLAALSLVLNYNSSLFDFVGVTQAIPQFGSTFIANEPAPGGTLYFAWYDVNPISSFGNLFFAKFVALGTGTSSLSWVTVQSELALSSGDVILNTTYSNGNISSLAIPTFNGSISGNTSVSLNGNTTLTASVNNASSLRWQVSTNGLIWNDLVDDAVYSGTATSSLSIIGVQVSMQGLRYRIVASSGASCSRASGSVLLSVILPAPIVSVGSSNGCIGDTLTIPITLQNGYGLGALTLGLGYNASQLEFVGVSNVNSSIANSAIINAPQPGGSLLLSWYDLNPVNINGLLFNARFRVTGAATSSLSWDLNFSEIADSNAGVIGGVAYNNGNISTSSPSLSSLNVTVCSPATYNFFGSVYNSSGVYSYTLSNAAGCDSVVTLNLTVNQPSASTINQTICAPSVYSFNGQNYSTSGTYSATLTNALGCDSLVTLNLIVNQPSVSTINQSICAPNSYSFNGQTYTSSGTYTATLTNSVGCDSVVTLNLTVNPLPVVGAVNGNTSVYVGGNVSLSTSVQGGVSLQWQVSTDGGTSFSNVSNGSGYSGATTSQLSISGITAGMSGYVYRLKVVGAGGCEVFSATRSLSIVIPNLGITSATGCTGDTITVSVSITNASNLGAISLALNYDAQVLQFIGRVNTNAQVASNLITNAPSPGGTLFFSWYNLTPANLNGQMVDLRFRKIGAGNSSLIWDDQIVELADISGNVVGALTYTNGSVTGLPSSASSVSAAVCAPATYSFFGQTYSSSGTYTKVLRNYLGCDSVITLNLIVKQPSASTLNQSICAPNSYSFNGQSYSSSGTYTATLTNSVGCDSVVTLNLTVNQPTSSSISRSVCAPGVVTIGNQSFGATGTYTAVISNAAGCDSVITLNLTVNQPSSTTLYDTLCSGSSAVVGSQSFGSTGVYTVTLTNAVGCDSIVTLHLIVMPAPAVISIQPTMSYVGVGDVAIFSVAVSDALWYQWQVRSGVGSWTNVTNSSTYAGAQSSSLQVTTTASMNNQQYRVLVRGCQGVIESSAATLVLFPQSAAIQVSVPGVSVCPSQTVVVPVLVSNFTNVGRLSLTLNYNSAALQLVNFSFNGGFSQASVIASGDTIRIVRNLTSGVSLTNDTLVRLTFQALGSGVQPITWMPSAAATIGIATASPAGLVHRLQHQNGTVTIGGTSPSISNQPVSAVVQDGGSTSFSVAASNAVSYQWQVRQGNVWVNLSNQSPYSGVNTTTLNINPVTSSLNNYRYRVQVSGACPPAVTSNQVTLGVNPNVPSIGLAIGSSFICTPGNVSIPVSAVNFNDVAALGLAMQYNSSAMTFTGISSIHSSVSGLTAVVLSANRISINWVSATPSQMGAGELFRLNFSAQSSGVLTWDSTTAGLTGLVSTFGQPLPVYYGNGGVQIAQNSVSISSVPSLCANGPAVALQGSPAGGVFSGTGVTGGVFHPSIVGPGTYLVSYTATDASSCTFTSSTFITVLPLPIGNAGPDQTICQGSSTTLTASSGSGLSYLWSTGATTQSISVTPTTASTQYWVRISNASGCSITDTILVNTFPSAVVSAGSDAVICSGSSTNLSASGAVQYLWSPATGLSSIVVSNPVASPLITTSYIVTGISVTGCITRDTVIVTVNPRPTIQLADTVVTYCGSGAGALLEASGAISYVWSPVTGLSDANISSPVATPATTTVYTVTGTDANGCTNTATVRVFVPRVNAGSNRIICSGASTTLSTTYTGSGLGLLYQWTPATGLSSAFVANPVASPMQSTLYTVTVTDPSGCAVSSSVTVIVNPSPTVDAGLNVAIAPTQSIQLTGSVSGGASPVSILWTPSSGLSATGILNPVATPSVTTMYYLTATGSNGCSRTDSVLVTVDPNLSGSNISGRLVYRNVARTGISQGAISLDTSSVVQSSINVGSNGAYLFQFLADRTYSLRATVNRSAGGITSADAQLINNYLANPNLMNGIAIQAADVDGNGVVNSADALLVIQRSVNLPSAVFNQFSPNRGDWITEQPLVNIQGANVDRDVEALSLGDVNADFNLAGARLPSGFRIE